MCEDIDSKIRFSIEPLPAGGDDAFEQWRDGMKAVAGLPLGIPADFRKKVYSSSDGSSNFETGVGDNIYNIICRKCI